MSKTYRKNKTEKKDVKVKKVKMDKKNKKLNKIKGAMIDDANE